MQARSQKDELTVSQVSKVLSGQPSRTQEQQPADEVHHETAEPEEQAYEEDLQQQDEDKKDLPTELDG